MGDQEMEDRDAKASGHLSGAATPQQTEEKKEEQLEDIFDKNEI